MLHSFGTTADTPIAGDWNGDGITQIGVRRGATYYLDYNGNGKWDWPGNMMGNFGLETDTLISGYWGP